jgi:hypothetical protein
MTYGEKENDRRRTSSVASKVKIDNIGFSVSWKSQIY